MTAKDPRPTFEEQLSELLLQLTPDQQQAALDLLRLLTEGVGGCPYREGVTEHG